MIETKLEWHYYKDEMPEVGRTYIHLYKNGDLISTILYTKIEDEEEYCERYRDDMWAYIETPKVKEFHVWLDIVAIPDIEKDVYYTYIGVKYALEGKESIIHTTQTSFLRTSILDDYRLFVHKDGKQIEITLGECQGTDRIIKAGDNLEKLVLGGEFSFD